MPTQNSDGTWSAKIRDKDFSFSKWGAEKSLMTFAELSRIAAAGIGDAAMSLNRADAEEMTGTIISLIIKGIGQGLGNDAKATLRLMKRLCCDDVFVDGQPLAEGAFDTFFRDDIFFAFEVAQATLEVQYQSFFKRLAPVFTLIRGKMDKNTSQSSTQT